MIAGGRIYMIRKKHISENYGISTRAGLVQEGETLPYTTGAIPGTIKFKDIDGYLKDENGNLVLDDNGIPKRLGQA